jgi:hypothetical protein
VFYFGGTAQQIHEFLKKNAAPSPPLRNYRIKRYLIGYGTEGEVLGIILASSEDDALAASKKTYGDLVDGEMRVADLMA